MRSALFDDIYFSPEDGLAEARHVFLAGNNLPAAWRGRDQFVIIETGFGTGLNFLAAWTLFEVTAMLGQKLHYISFEKHPLSWDEISRALSRWRREFGGRMDRLRALYPLRVPGFHRLMLNEQVSLTLIFDDVNEALPQLDAPCGADAWFLDGFAPAKNPEMWTETVFREMARLSSAGATFATFTAAGAVRRGLTGAGFAVEKKEGFGRKRDMLAGVFTKGRPPAKTNKTNRIAIVGGGLAGTAAAFVLKRSGMTPVIFEQGDRLAPGASGNAMGLYNPRFSQRRTAESDFYTAGFAQAVRTFGELQRGFDIGFNPSGSLHLLTDPEREKKLRGASENWGWHKSHLHIMDATAASHRAGIKLETGALCLPEAGTVNPAALCRAYADGVEVRLNTSAGPDDLKDFGAVILAGGAGVKNFPLAGDLPVHTVRGQITQVKATAATADLKMNLCFGGYISAPVNGLHMLGATFQQWREDDALTDEDHCDNIKRLRDALPGMGDFEITGGRAALRASSKDRFPVIGRAESAESLFLSAAHGSHGLASTLTAAHLLADLLTGSPASLSARAAAAPDPGRFARRAARKAAG